MKDNNQVTTDPELIEREVQHFNILVLQRGLSAANTEVISKLTACVLWLDNCHGTRRSYELFQGVADGLIEHGRDAPVNAV